MSEEYVPSAENRKMWCRGKVGRPHQFQFWKYVPKAEGYPENQPRFLFQCVVCGRMRACIDPEGKFELNETDDQDEIETPELRPVTFSLRVYVDAIAEDGSRRRFCDHIEFSPAQHLSDEDLEEVRQDYIRVAYQIFQEVRKAPYE